MPQQELGFTPSEFLTHFFLTGFNRFRLWRLHDNHLPLYPESFLNLNHPLGLFPRKRESNSAVGWPSGLTPPIATLCPERCIIRFVSGDKCEVKNRSGAGFRRPYLRCRCCRCIMGCVRRFEVQYGVFFLRLITSCGKKTPLVNLTSLFHLCVTTCCPWNEGKGDGMHTLFPRFRLFKDAAFIHNRHQKMPRNSRQSCGEKPTTACCMPMGLVRFLRGHLRIPS